MNIPVLRRWGVGHSAAPGNHFALSSSIVQSDGLDICSFQWRTQTQKGMVTICLLCTYVIPSSTHFYIAKYLIRRNGNTGASSSASTNVTEEVQARCNNILHKLMFFHLLQLINVVKFLNYFQLLYHTHTTRISNSLKPNVLSLWTVPRLTLSANTKFVASKRGVAIYIYKQAFSMSLLICT